MAHHCHSDLDYDERDPYFEYNKCNQFEYVEKKLQGKLEEFVPVNLNYFMIKSKHKIQTKCDLLEELDRIIKRKYLHAMQELVNPDPIMDKREERTFQSYLQNEAKLQTMPKKSIGNYQVSNYFYDDNYRPSSSLLNVSLPTDSLYKRSDYTEFPNPVSMTNGIKSDLEQFYEYEKFDLDSLDQVKFRKVIVQEINQVCPFTEIQDNFDEWINMKARNE